VEKEKAKEMEMAVPRSNAYGLYHGCSRHAVHDVLSVHGWVAAASSRRLMTHKYRKSQQSSREVKPKFIDSTQGKLKDIYKP
jgi:hypothetical protein